MNNLTHRESQDSEQLNSQRIPNLLVLLSSTHLIPRLCRTLFWGKKKKIYIYNIYIYIYYFSPNTSLFTGKVSGQMLKTKLDYELETSCLKCTHTHPLSLKHTHYLKQLLIFKRIEEKSNIVIFTCLFHYSYGSVVK